MCAATGGEKCIRSLTRKQVERAAEASFGERALGDDEIITLKNHEAPRHWFSLVFQHRRVEMATGLVTVLHYHLDGRPVCRGVFRDAHGMTRTTFDSIERRVLNGDSQYSMSRRVDSQRQPSEFFCATVVWWTGLFRCFDHTTKHGKLLYEVRRRNATYAEEFVPTMHALGHNWRVPKRDEIVCSDGSDAGDDDDLGSPGLWYRARNVALQRYAVDTYGRGAKSFALKSRRQLCARCPPLPPIAPHCACACTLPARAPTQVSLQAVHRLSGQ